MKKLLCFLPLLCMLCGCYPYTEIENMDIFTSLYADTADAQFLLGGGVANVRSFSDAMAENPVSLLYGRGNTLEDAALHLRQSADHELFFGALRAIVLGESLAKTDIGPLLHYLDAQPRLRRSTAVFVTDADIESVVGYKAINDFSGGFAADSIITTLDTLGEMHYTSIGDVLHALTYEDAGFCIPHIRLQDDILRVDGYTLFSGTRAVGFTQNMAVAFFTLKNATAQYIENNAALTAKLTKKHITPDIHSGKLHINVDMTFKLQQGKGADTLRSAHRRKAMEAIEQKLQMQIEAVLAEVRETECDFLELYRYRMAQSRSDFDMRAWNSMLKTMTYSVRVTLK